MSSPRPGAERSPNPILPARPNLRGLGHVPLSGGRCIVGGALYRAPALTALAPHEVAAVAALDLTLVIDFRQPSEAAAASVDLPVRAGAVCLALPIATGAGARVLMAPADPPISDAEASAAMTEVYRDFVRANAQTFATFLERLAAADGPVLFHCTAGKDRTGFAAALVLTALGAARDAVMANFLATATLWTPDDDLRARIAPGAQAAVLGVRPAYLDAALDELDRQHGGASRFAKDALGDAGLRDWTHRITIPDTAAPAAPQPQEMT